MEIYRRRRDVMLESLNKHFPAEATWTEPEGGLFIWATLPEYIDTGDLLAKALRDDVAFVPGQAAYVDDRGRNSMRLNFSGVNEDEPRGHKKDRQSHRRASRVVWRLDRQATPARNRPAYGGGRRPEPWAEFIQNPAPSSGPDHDLTPSGPDEGRADQAESPPDQGGGRRCLSFSQNRRRVRMKVAVLHGRSLPRLAASRCAPAPESRTRWSGLGTRSWRSTSVARAGQAANRRAPRRGLRRHARAGRRGRHRAGAAGDPRHPLHRARRGGLRPLHGQGARQARAARGGHPGRAGLVFAFNETAFRELGAADALGQMEERLGFPLVIAAAAALPWGEVRGALVRGAGGAGSRPSATTTGCCWSASSRGASWRSACSATSRCRWSKRSRPGATATTSRRATRSAAPPSAPCPAELTEAEGGAVTRGSAGRACPTGHWAHAGFARVDLILGEDGPQVLEVNAIPGLTDTSLQGRRGRRHPIRAAGREDSRTWR